MKARRETYPPEAYVGEDLWWDRRTWPGKKALLGAEPRLAAWLTYNVVIGDTFTMPELRAGLARDGVPNADEHLNRRLRELRKIGWLLPTNDDDKTIAVGTYRVDSIGWNPVKDPRPKREGISKALTRKVFERDGRRCRVCGTGANEPYPGEPGTSAAMTVGHRQARAHQGSSSDPDNLETQCRRCNETVREEVVPETVESVFQDLVGIRKGADLEKLETWIEQGHRSRDPVDRIFDKVRTLSPKEREQVIEEVRRRLGR